MSTGWASRSTGSTVSGRIPALHAVSRGGLSLHLSEHHGDATPGSAVFVETDGVEALHREIAAKPYRYLKPGLEDASWGAHADLA